jgi:hypothetical protein
MLVLRLLRGCLCVCLASLLISCPATVPKQTYLTSASLLGISKVAVVVSASAPKVSYYERSQLTLHTPTAIALKALPRDWWGSLVYFLFPPLFVPATVIAVVAMADLAISQVPNVHNDNVQAETVGKHVDLGYIEGKLAQSFIQPLRGSPCFQTIEYVTDKKQDDRQLSAAGNNAVIRLSVQEISLDQIAGDNVSLRILVHGEMKCLSAGKIVWDREEYGVTSDPHSLAYYKENGLKELDAMLEKAGKKLAYDFIYVK